jgi:ABC-type glycerol-3-phosphate transport system substrate-binding protein
MGKIFRFVSLLLACLTLLTIVSCAKPGENETETTLSGAANDTSAPETSDPTIDEKGYLKDNLPGDLNYNTDVSILHWNDYTRPEFYIETANGDVANDAVYKRNLQIEERLGVKLKWTGTPGNVSNTSNFVGVVQKSYLTGDHAYDIIATYSRTAGLLSVDGYLADINAIEGSYLDFDKPWWPQNMINTVTIGNSVYFITGDAATSVLHYMTAIFYNKELFDKLNLEYPAVDVKNNTWTLDKLITISSNCYQDLDGNTKVSEGDLFGFSTIYYNADAFYTGTGMLLVDHDPDNLLKISDDFYG